MKKSSIVLGGLSVLAMGGLGYAAYNAIPLWTIGLAVGFTPMTAAIGIAAPAVALIAAIALMVAAVKVSGGKSVHDKHQITEASNEAKEWFANHARGEDMMGRDVKVVQPVPVLPVELPMSEASKNPFDDEEVVAMAQQGHQVTIG